jgi:hypothetical protein
MLLPLVVPPIRDALGFNTAKPVAPPTFGQLVETAKQ